MPASGKLGFSGMPSRISSTWAHNSPECVDILFPRPFSEFSVQVTIRGGSNILAYTGQPVFSGIPTKFRGFLEEEAMQSRFSQF